MASRYSRYEPDRRSRSPRDRSPDRFERNSQFGDGDRRRSSAEARSNSSGFQANRESFADPARREPPRGPKALVDAPSGPRGGGFAGDFRGGRGRGRGRGWPARDESRDRGRDRDMDYRDRYRDDRSRERDRDRDRDWRDSRDFRSRRSPVGRARSPSRDFRDRDGPPGIDADRSRRGSRDGGPPSAGSALSDPYSPFRGAGIGRGRGRGGRGDWSSDRGRGRTPYDDRGDRYPRSRSQEGRWGRERDDRDRGDRYPETDMRRDPREERDRGERDLIRPKKEPRPSISQEIPSQTKEVSPPPVAPSAPEFGSIPSRSAGGSDIGAPSGMGKLPPTAPRAFGDRPVSAGHDSAIPPAGPSRSSIHDSSPIPVGPRAHQQRPSSKQWINPNLKKAPDSPKIVRAQTFVQPSQAPLRRGSTQVEQRPRSSDAKSDPRAPEFESRARSHHSAEPGEITVKSELDSRSHGEYADRSARSASSSGLSPTAPAATRFSHDPGFGAVKPIRQPAQEVKTQEVKRKRRWPPTIPVVRFALPPKKPVPEQDSESDDDDMADYFDMEIQKTQAELSKLPKPSLPRDVVARFAAMSHGSMAQVLNEREGLTDMLGPVPDDVDLGSDKISEQLLRKPMELDAADGAALPKETVDADAPMEEPEHAAMPESQTKTEEMDIDAPSSIVPPAPDSPPATVDADIDAKKASLASSVQAKEGAVADAGMRQTPLPEPVKSGSKPPSTPSQVPDEDDDETESEDEAYMNIDTVRQFMATPPLDSLPDYGSQDWTKDKDFLASLESDPAIDNFVLEHLDKIHIQETEEQTDSQKLYSDSYVNYLKFTLSNDPVAVKSRDKFSVAAPVVEGTGTVTPESKPEGRGTGRRFATERDLERVLQASMREDEERKEREQRAQKEKYRSDKEAVIPDMYWDAEQRAKAQYTDRSGYTPQDKLVAAWRVLPPVNNFTEEESELFEKRYLELPKQWGKVAEVIPNRDFGTCIQYYYLMKKELNLKEKLKKQPKRRKKGGRGKQRSSALVSELGNGEQEGEETQDTGDNGERRRPRRAAAPTWGFEQPTTDSENATPAGTPGRRSGAASARGELGEKVDGRKGRRKTAKDKDAKGAKANQTLSAAPTPTAGRGRSRSSSRVPPNVEFQPPTPSDPNRMPAVFEQPAAQSSIPAPYPVQAQPQQGAERPKALASSSISDVMAAPSLRPEPPPPPQSSMTTFNLAQSQTERKAPTQASSYWSVSETSDFPHLLRAFGSDWTAIAAHMGSKTAVMVKNYFVRQKDLRAEWEGLVQEADAKRLRGEKRPDPPQLTTGGRSRRYDNVAVGSSRPLAVAPGMDVQGEQSQVKMEAPPQQARPQPFSSYGVPIAQAPAQQPLAQPGQQPIAMQQHALPQPAVSQAMSPNSRPLRAPMQPFGFPERDREPASQAQQQRVPLPQKAGGSAVPELREQRILPAAQPTPAAHPDSMMERQKLEMQQQQQQQQVQRDRERERERDRERERELARQSERPAMRMNQEAELAPQRHYEPYGHRQQPSLGGGPREPLSLGRPSPQDPSRAGSSQPYPSVQQQGPHGVRNMMGDPGAAQSPPLGHLASRPMSSLQQRQPSGPVQDPYGAATPVQAASGSAVPPSRPPEPRKTSNIMSLLNDDPPPTTKRVSDVSGNPAGPSATPPPQGMGRTPPGPAPPSQLRREPESQYSPYGRAPSGGASAMPPLKPTYSGSPNPTPHMGSASAEREYYRHGSYQGGNHNGTNSPQASHRYPPPGQQAQPQYQPQGGYAAAYGGGSQTPHGASPPPQYSMHRSASRTREVPQGGRDNAWPHQGHQQPPPNMQQAGGWPTQAPKTQAPPPQQSWAPQHPSSTPKPSTPAQAWASAPPPQQPHHMSMRDERGSVYGSSSQPGQHRYGPPSSRAPDAVPPQGQPYPHYGSTPGQGPPRDPREPGRSYTPGVYDARGPPPPQQAGPGYPGPDPRDLQLRDGRDQRDPRDMMGRGLRPHEYERHQDRYGR